MAQTKILVDTNSYIRLAKSIHPLLFQSFGEVEYCLYVLPELNKELANHKLESRFHWINDAEYSENRRRFPTISRAQKNYIANTFEYIWEYVKADLPGPSRVDALYIAYALELDLPVVTDDQDMTTLATVFGAKTLSTMELLKIMFDSQHISGATVKGLFEYWRHITDLPANFSVDRQRLFPDM
jgi:hypothetical protein